MHPIIVIAGLVTTAVGMILPDPKPTPSEAGRALADQRNKGTAAPETTPKQSAQEAPAGSETPAQS